LQNFERGKEGRSEGASERRREEGKEGKSGLVKIF